MRILKQGPLKIGEVFTVKGKIVHFTDKWDGSFLWFLDTDEVGEYMIIPTGHDCEFKDHLFTSIQEGTYVWHLVRL